MAATPVVEHLDVLEQVGDCRVPRDVARAVDPFVLEAVEEALGGRIVPAVALAAHRTDHAVLGERGLEQATRVLGDFQRSSQHLAIGGVAWDDQRVGLEARQDVRRCGRRVGLGSTSGMPSRHSGQALRRELQARTRHWRAMCRSQLARAGSARPVGWRPSVWVHLQDDSCRR